MKRILVIEDHEAMRENIVEILQLAAYEVVQAANGKQGIEMARQTHPDLILCDIMMPELDGFGVLHIMANDPELAAVPFVFLTAKAEPTDFRAGMNLGADDYLTKPFDDLTLLSTVAMRLARSERDHPAPVPMAARLVNLAQAILHQNNTHQSLCDNYPTIRYPRKHQLYTAGTRPTVLYYISQGKVKLLKTDAAGNKYITALGGAGDFVGYLALLQETPYAETVELVEDSSVCAIPKTDFLTLIYHHPPVANQFIKLLAGNVADQQDQLLHLAYQSVRKRVAEALLLVQGKFYADEPTLPEAPANISLPMTLSRENWSHLVGASTETVIRVLSDLKAEGLIEINASQITLLDMEKLRQLK